MIPTWFPRNELEIRHAEKVLVTNTIGIIGYDVDLSIRNVGNRDATFSKLRLEIVGPSGNKQMFYGDSYIVSSPDGGGMVFSVSKTKIKPGEDWSQRVSFSRVITPDEEGSINKLRVPCPRI